MGGAIPPFRPHDLERNFRVALTQSAKSNDVYYWDLDQITLVCQPVELEIWTCFEDMMYGKRCCFEFQARI